MAPWYSLDLVRQPPRYWPRTFGGVFVYSGDQMVYGHCRQSIYGIHNKVFVYWRLELPPVEAFSSPSVQKKTVIRIIDGLAAELQMLRFSVKNSNFAV